MFNYDWFHGGARNEQIETAKWRCTLKHFPGITRADLTDREDVGQFHAELEVRQLIYLRDGFSYEIKEIAEVPARSDLVFECEPVDEHYKVGAFVVTVPFEEIVRVEVFVVHPSEKPEDMPQITGFRSQPEPGEARMR
ncbi:MAG TPA: hypothetical protein PKK06_04085 [Phycisphaerae bacterium]|nr:hypothetical protein [Phycisphaerae bacterium]HNU44878.1 hypothetical protein [Phycisphaerae bacterium]